MRELRASDKMSAKELMSPTRAPSGDPFPVFWQRRYCVPVGFIAGNTLGEFEILEREVKC